MVCLCGLGGYQKWKMWISYCGLVSESSESHCDGESQFPGHSHMLWRDLEKPKESRTWKHEALLLLSLEKKMTGVRAKLTIVAMLTNILPSVPR